MVTVINGSTENCVLLSSGGLLNRAHGHNQTTLNSGALTPVMEPCSCGQFKFHPVSDNPDPIPEGPEYKLITWNRWDWRRETSLQYRRYNLLKFVPETIP